MNVRASVCIDAVLADLPLEDAVRTVARCGYQAFEFWCWWEKDLQRVQGLCEELQLQVAACCTKFVSLVDAQQRDDYLAGLEQSIKAAQQLRCPVLISQVGDRLTDRPRAEQHASLVEGLRAAAAMLRGTGVTLAIEPLNELVDHAGYYLVRSDEAFEVIDEVGSPEVKVTFDIYHQQISEGHLIHRIGTHIDKIAHFHAAGNPGRHELTTGEIHYTSVLAAIAASGYQGFVGLEYWPEHDPAAGLEQVRSWFAKPA